MTAIEPYELCVDFQIISNNKKKKCRILYLSDKRGMKSKRKGKIFKQQEYYKA